MSTQKVEDVAKRSGPPHCHHPMTSRECEREGYAVAAKSVPAESLLTKPQTAADHETGSHSVPVNGGLAQGFPEHTDLWARHLLLEAMIKSLPAWVVVLDQYGVITYESKGCPQVPRGGVSKPAVAVVG